MRSAAASAAIAPLYPHLPLPACPVLVNREIMEATVSPPGRSLSGVYGYDVLPLGEIAAAW